MRSTKGRSPLPRCPGAIKRLEDAGVDHGDISVLASNADGWPGVARDRFVGGIVFGPMRVGPALRIHARSRTNEKEARHM